jgi:antitoxin (DNA-binding transcriptional repressor) of toxin-antitoxin stability system
MSISFLQISGAAPIVWGVPMSRAPDGSPPFGGLGYPWPHARVRPLYCGGKRPRVGPCLWPDIVRATTWGSPPTAAVALWARRAALAHGTRYGHDVVMKRVRIAELKSHLSEYLRAVRGGQTIAVLDRETAVAQIVPIRERTVLKIRKPPPGTPPLNRVPLPKPLKIRIDIVDLLLEERQIHR